MVITLNGPINSGKSTIAKLIATNIPNTAIVEVDIIREFLSVEGSPGWEICFRASVGLVAGFVKEGVNVVFIYHISKKDFEYIHGELEKYNVDTYAFTLKPTLESLTKDRGSRPLNEYLLNKVQRTYDSEEYRGDYGKVIDNTNQTPEETLAIILNHIKRTDS